MSVSGALFDGDKLNDVSKNIVSRMDSNTVVEKLTEWAKEFDPEFYGVLTRDLEYTKAVFAIDRDVPKPRKDIAKWNEAKQYCAYFYPEYYVPSAEYPENLDKADIKAFLSAYKDVYSADDSKEDWFAKIKSLCPSLGFAAETKEYKANKEAYKGSAGDLSTVLRVAITGRRNTPDLCSIMQVIGFDECIKRIEDAVESL
jgi:glutamyl-tRNA synthetase